MLRWIAACLLSCLVLAPAAAWADAGRIEVDISPGPLREAIDLLASSAHLQVLYEPAIVAGRFTHGVKGSMTPAQALDLLLAATDIAYRFTAEDAVALYRKDSAADVTPTSTRLPATANALPLQTVRVSAPRSDGGDYRSDSVLTAMKVDGPALVAPVTTQSLTQQVLLDQQATRVEDVLEDISSVEAAPDGQATLGFMIRGFPTYQYYVDGVRVSPDLHHDGFRDLANVERIDVVKGPASTLYGRTEPGGLINIVTKQPLSQPYLALEEQVGAFGHYRTRMDAGGPLSAGKSLLYRFNAAYETGDSFRELLSNRRVFLAPVVTWKASPDTQMTAYLEYLRSDDPTDSGLPMVGADLPPVHIERRVEDGGDVHTRDLRVGVRGFHAFNDRWSARYHLDGRRLDTPQSPRLVLANDGLDPGNCSDSSCPVDQSLLAIPVSEGRTYYGSAELLGALTFLGARHSVLLGAEYFDVRGQNEVSYSNTAFATDLIHPVHGPVPDSLLQNPDSAYGTSTTERWGGVYLQDQIAFAETLFVTLGARYDHVREWLLTRAGVPPADTGTDERSDSAFRRRAALLWHPTERLSFYANYMENFGISTGIYGTGRGGTGTLVPPESAHEWEVGAKAEFLEGKAAGSLAWFDLTQVNISLPVFNPLQQAAGFRRVTGAARSRGLELDLQGEIAPGLKLLASYAFLDSRITDDVGSFIDDNGQIVFTPGNTGHRLYGVPRHGGSLWVAYRPSGPLHGLRLGLGTVVRSWREGDNENDYQLPGFAKWKLLAGYDWTVAQARLSLQLNVDNVFNARYFESLSGAHTVMPGCPRRWLVSMRLQL